MAQCDTAQEKGVTRICGKAGSGHRPYLPDPKCRLWRDRHDLFPGLYDHMLVTEDGRRLPSCMEALWSMSGNLGDKVETEKRNRNLGVDLPVTVFMNGVRGDLLEMLFELYYTGEIEIDLSNFQDIYKMSHELQFGVGIDACREYVDETLSPETASMLLSICEKYDQKKAQFVNMYIEDNDEGEKRRQSSIKERNAGPVWGTGRSVPFPKSPDPKDSKGQDPKGTADQNPKQIEGQDSVSMTGLDLEFANGQGREDVRGHAPDMANGVDPKDTNGQDPKDNK